MTFRILETPYEHNPARPGLLIHLITRTRTRDTLAGPFRFKTEVDRAATARWFADYAVRARAGGATHVTLTLSPDGRKPPGWTHFADAGHHVIHI